MGLESPFKQGDAAGSSDVRGLRVADLASDRGLAIVAGLVTLLVAAVMLATAPDLTRAFGDTDDAVRLSMVRDLVHGQGWFDQRVQRLQPPLGVFMHWSRLIDGGEALTDGFFRLFLPPQSAELAMRTTWPMLWIWPSVLAVLAAARRLAAPAASGASVLACALLLLIADPFIYGQFVPGRVDHHNVQIALCLVAAVGVISGPGVRGPLVAGIATGLGLAIGFEGMILEAVAAMAMAIRFVLDPKAWRALVAYAAALGAATAAAFLIQTPPQRLSLVLCDSLALNTVVVVLLGGAGLVIAALLTRGRDWRFRLGAVGVAGALALGVFLSLKSACVFGPLADVDPRVRPFWFDDIRELRSFATLAVADPSSLIIIATPLVAALAALAALFRLRRGRPPEFPLIAWSALALVAIALAATAERMSFYALWLAPAPLAALIGEILLRRKETGWLPTVTISLLLCPLLPTAALALGVLALSHKPAGAGRQDLCMLTRSYDTLKRLPAGLVVGDLDLGPYVVAATPSSALAAPYHRMTWGILRNEEILAARGARAEALARTTGAAYVMECRAHRARISRHGLAPDALQSLLDNGTPPAWLELMSPAGSPVEIYRVAPSRAPE